MLKETLFLFIIRVMSAIFGILITGSITNNLTVSNSGDYFLILTMVIFVIPFALMGFGQLSLKNIAKLDSTDVESYFSIVLIGTFVSSISYILYLYLLSPLESELSIIELCLLFSIVFLSCLSEYLLFIYQGIRKAWLGTLLNVVLRQAIFLTSIYFYELSSFSSVLWLYSAASVCCLLISFFMLHKLNIKFTLKLYSLRFSSLYQKSRNFQLTHILGSFNGSIAPIMLGLLSSAKDVAIFVVCIKIAAISSFILMPINRVVAPRYAKAFTSGTLNELQTIAQLACRLSLVLMCPLLVLMYVFNQELLGYFGDFYRENGTTIFLVLLVSQFVNVITGSVGWLLQMCGEEKLFRNISLFSVCISIAIGSYFIPVIGALGAALMYSCSLIVTNILASYYVSRRLNVIVFKFW